MDIRGFWTLEMDILKINNHELKQVLINLFLPQGGAGVQRMNLMELLLFFFFKEVHSFPYFI